MLHKTIIALIIATTLSAHAEYRDWKSADGSRSLAGEFVSRDDKSVTIRRKNDRRKFTLKFSQIHPSEVKWLDTHHPLPGKEFYNPTEMFDVLSFGNSMGEVIEKLENFKKVKANIPKTMFGRGGINGVFEPIHPVGELNSLYYFGWDDANKLKEVSLHSESLPAASFEKQLKPCWEACIPLLTAKFGEPFGSNPKLDINPIPNNEISFTHKWKLQGGGSALLGAGQKDGEYLIIIRFTTDEH